jgi:uncharacterized protein YbjT (DUF2867 family)
MNQTKLLLTGATGRVGQLVAASLNARGAKWRAFARQPEAAKHLGAADVVQGQFDSPEALAQAMQGIECVVLISGDAPDQELQELAVVTAAKKAGVLCLVKLSAQSAGLNPPVSFGRKHRVVEDAIQQSGLAWTFIRPVFFQQSFLLFADSVRKNNKLILPAGRGACAFVDARDVADCLALVATSDGHSKKIYTLTGPQALQFAEAAQKIALLRGKSVGYFAPPAWLARLVLPKAAGMPRWLAMEVVDLFQAIAKGAQAGVTADVQTLLGKMPRNFEAFAQENISAFQG